MYKNNKPGREPFSRDNHPPAVLNHQHTASRSRHQFSFIHDKDAVAYIAYQRKIMGDE